jgi:arylsulfatase A-like enzyme
MTTPPATNRPSFLFISTDQQRADCLGCYGNPVLQTPNIDSLAATGVRLDCAYVTNPLCMPARATLLTGRYPDAHRVRNNGIPLRTDERTLAAELGQAGYRTALIGKAHFAPYLSPAASDSLEALERWQISELDHWRGPYYGFEQVELTLSHHRPEGHYGLWLAEHFPQAPDQMLRERKKRQVGPAPDCWVSQVPVEAHNTTWIARRTIEQLKACQDEDFFIWCSFPDPHHPFAPPAPFATRYNPADMPPSPRRAGELAERPPHFLTYYETGRKHEGTQRGVIPAQITDEQLQLIKAHYYGTIALIDQAVGEILRTLEALNLRQRTIVVFTSDHGELLGDHGLLFKGPFLYEGLIRIPFIWSLPHSRQPAASPALVSQVDIAPTILDYAGLNLSHIPGLQGRSLAPLLNGEQQTHRDSVVIDFHSDDHPDLILRALRTPEWKLVSYAGQRWGELINLVDDPDELHNLYGRPEYAAVQCQLESQLLAELISRADVLPPRLANA